MVFFGSPILELLLCHPLTHVGVVMITIITMASVAGFFIGIATHLTLTQLAQKRKVELVRVGSNWQVYK